MLEYIIIKEEEETNMMTICLVEDEEDLNQMLKIYLEKAGYQVISCFSMGDAEKVKARDIGIWVIDIMLPDGNGLELLKEIKTENGDTPVVIISAKGDRFDRVAGFEIGCDDYIAKPFLPAELVFRVERLKKQAAKPVSDLLALGPYTLDLSRRMIFEKEERVDITSRELDIILFFIRHRGQAISREQLLQAVWGEDYFGNDRVVDNYVKNIRKKLPQMEIETIYGYGYRYNL